MSPHSFASLEGDDHGLETARRLVSGCYGDDLPTVPRQLRDLLVEFRQVSFDDLISQVECLVDEVAQPTRSVLTASAMLKRFRKVFISRLNKRGALKTRRLQL